MALFQKKPQVSSSAPLYTLGLSRSLLIVGLGNVGKEFDGTRHNIGFYVLDNFVASNLDFANWTTKKDLKCILSTATLANTRVIAIKPTTLMNHSGEAVRATCDFYKIPPQDVLVIYDELDLPFGTIRTGVGGGSAGHNGVTSVIGHISPDFNRMRIGIGSEHAARNDAAKFVLTTFNAKEQKELTNLKQEALAILSEYVHGGSKIPTETRRFIV